MLALGGLWAGAEDKAVSPPGGSILGRVSWEDAIPESRKWEVDGGNAKGCTCPEGRKHVKPDESLVVDPETKGVAHAVVWLKGVKGGPVLGPVEIDQKGCVFAPHVALVSVGQKVKVLNPEGIVHNFHLYSQQVSSDEQNITMAKFKKWIEVPKGGFAKPEFIRTVCDIHAWMGGWIAVMENGYAARTDAKGAFRIEGVPPGKYTLALWHEPLTPEGRPILMEKGILIEAGEVVDAPFFLKAEAKP